MKHFLKLTICIGSLIIFSCDGDDSSKPDQTNSSTILKSENKVLRNQEIAFYDMDGNTDNTEYATFYVNDIAIEGNKFSSPTEGVFQIYSKYNLEGVLTTSQIDSFEVYIPRKKALIEGFTGTWCGNCPPLDFSVEKAQDSIKDLVIVMIHGGREYPGSQDPYTIPEGTILGEFLEILGYPTGVIDRTFFWDYWRIPPLLPFPLYEIMPYAGLDTDISIAINSELKNENLSVNVKIISEQVISNSKLVVFLLEDGLLYDQVNYRNNDEWSPFYQMGNPIVDFEHNDVLRMSITDPLGDVIPETSALTEYNRDFNVNISSEFNTSNLKLVVTLLDENNLVRNTQQVPINQIQDYE